jgi:phosphoglycerol transferase MdoB-like AlkP superfamily enzyme
MTDELVKWIVDIVGWIAAVELITAYALISYKKVDADSALFQWLNLTGSIFLIVNTYYYHAYPSTIVNVFWLFIAFFALIRIMRKTDS